MVYMKKSKEIFKVFMTEIDQIRELLLFHSLILKIDFIIYYIAKISMHNIYYWVMTNTLPFY
jgi:hypothetical protein